jgi:rhodanese-related sulfurtransferase
MAVETLPKESALAVEYFESKLNFETTPFSLNQSMEKKEKMQIIDLRTPELFAQGHIPGAINVDITELEKYLPKLDKHTTTVVYCYDLLCRLATRAALLLAKHGYKVKELAGGWDSWSDHDLAKEKGTASSCSTSKHSSCA